MLFRNYSFTFVNNFDKSKMCGNVDTNCVTLYSASISINLLRACTARDIPDKTSDEAMVNGNNILYRQFCPFFCNIT